MSLPQVIAPVQQRLVTPTGWKQWLPFKPDPDFVPSRTLVLSEHAYGQCQPDSRSKDQDFSGKMHMNLLAALEGFVGGDEIHEGLEMDWLLPHTRNIWEIRAFTAPQSRLIGWFAAYDIFFGIRAYPRQDLGDGRAAGWRDALNKCEEKRTSLGSVIFSQALFAQHMSNAVGKS